MSDDILGRYRLLERIGIGGMAEVFVARAQGLVAFSHSVVVKRMLPQLADNKDAVGMFVDEARLGAKLFHPHIVRVVDLGEVGGKYYMVLEYVDGADLGLVLSRARARGQTLPLEHAAWITCLAARGLHFAHTATDPDTRAPLGVVHRDVSPSNILIGKAGDVKIADFGVARSNVQSVRTRTGNVKGKVTYMSPEQLTGGELDPRSDVYALGVLLWELLTGVRLHEGRNEAQIIQAVQSDDSPKPSSKNPAVPAVLDDLVLRCLSRERAQRPATAAEVADVLARWVETQPAGGASGFEAWLGRRPYLFEADGTISAEGSRSTMNAARTPSLRKLKDASGAKSFREGLKSPAQVAERKRDLVLYVEDEPENRAVAELRLKRSYDLLLASNDEEACHLLRSRAGEISAILMDIQLKGSALDGIELVRLVRGTLLEVKKPSYALDLPILTIPILFVTAYGARYSEPELLAAGAQKLVTKPVNFAELTLALVDAQLKRLQRP